MKMCSVQWWMLAALAALSACGGSSKMIPQGPPPATATAAIADIPYDPDKQAYSEARGVAEYLLGAGDVLDVALRGLDVVKERVPIRADGNVSFSLVDNVPAAGRTITELDEDLTMRLKKYLRDPKLDITIAEYNSKKVSVQGAILSVFTAAGQKTGPGRYGLKGKVRVLDMLLEAGGTTPDAQLDRVQLIRGDVSYRLNIQRVLSLGDTRDNIVLQDGDLLFVPGIARQSKKVVILGEVHNPNVYVFSEDVSFLEALGQAGGLTDSAIRDDVRIIRNVDGVSKMFSINYERLVSGKDLANNVRLESNDIIYASRSFMGDVNDVIAKITPTLDLLLIPANYGNAYTTAGSQWIHNGLPAAATAGQLPTTLTPTTTTAADSTKQGK